MIERLTTLAAVKDWLDIPELNQDGTPDTTSDALLTRLIVAASQYALNYMSRDSFAALDYTYNFRGNGKNYQLLRNWPIISVASVGVFGNAIQAATSTNLGNWTNGFRIGNQQGAPQSIDLYGWLFCYLAPCQITYRAGYELVQETVIEEDPSTDPVAINALPFTPTAGGQWILDEGVVIDGDAAAKVPYDLETTLAAGEYMVSEWGRYIFSIADIGKTAAILYSFCPMDVSQAVTELIGAWFRRKDRIGLLSKTLGGQETVTFSLKDLTDTVKDTFDWYASVAPM